MRKVTFCVKQDQGVTGLGATSGTCKWKSKFIVPESQLAANPYSGFTPIPALLYCSPTISI